MRLKLKICDFPSNIPQYSLLAMFFIGPWCPRGPIYGSGCLKLTKRRFADLIDVTLADEDTNSILTDNANRAIQVVQPGCQLWN